MLRGTSLLLVMLLVMPASAVAQEAAESFAHLTQQQVLKVGNTLWVTHVAEGEDTPQDIKVRFLDLTSSEMTVFVDGAELMIEERDVRQIVREQRGPLWNGALWGAAIGGGTCLLLFWSFPDNRSDLIPFTAVWAGIGAGIGMGVDALKKEQRTVYLQPRSTEGRLRLAVSPLVSKDQKGVLFGVQW